VTQRISTEPLSREEAAALAAAHFETVTGLKAGEKTEPPAKRIGQWACAGVDVEREPSEGREDVAVMWQFERKDADPNTGYDAGWHNFLLDPKTGVNSVVLVETMFTQHRQWGLWGGGTTGTRHVQSGTFSYTVVFDGKLDGPTHGTQTNTKTGVQRTIRRVAATEACTCSKCAGAESSIVTWKPSVCVPVGAPPPAKKGLMRLFRRRSSASAPAAR
jgi:hypothetical protein